MNVGRGRLLPTLPWEAIWNSVSQWIGVDNDDLDYILPNRISFPSSLLFDKSDLFMMKTESNVNDCVGDKLSVSCILENGDNDEGDGIPGIDSSKTASKFGIITIIATCIGVIAVIGLAVMYRRRRLHRKVDIYLARMENKNNHSEIMVIETKGYESRDDHTEGGKIM